MPCPSKSNIDMNSHPPDSVSLTVQKRTQWLYLVTPQRKFTMGYYSQVCYRSPKAVIRREAANCEILLQETSAMRGSSQLWDLTARDFCDCQSWRASEMTLERRQKLALSFSVSDSGSRGHKNQSDRS